MLLKSNIFIFKYIIDFNHLIPNTIITLDCVGTIFKTNADIWIDGYQMIHNLLRHSARFG